MIKENKAENAGIEKRIDIAICISKLGNEISSIYEISYCVFNINTEKVLVQEKIPITLPLSFNINTKELIDWLEFGSDNFLLKNKSNF